MSPSSRTCGDAMIFWVGSLLDDGVAASKSKKCLWKAAPATRWPCVSGSKDVQSAAHIDEYDA